MPDDYPVGMLSRAMADYVRWQRRGEDFRKWGVLMAIIGGLLVGGATFSWLMEWNIKIGSGPNPVPLPIFLFILAASSLMTAVMFWVSTAERMGAFEEYSAMSAIGKAAEGVHGLDDLLGLMRLNRSQMDAYDLIARRQASSSHRASLGAMMVGLVMVGIGLSVAWFAPEPSTKYSAAIIAATATAAGGFIAQTFIRVQRGSQEQMRFYFQQPLIHSYLLMAERLAAQLPESSRNREYSAIIAASLQQAANVSAVEVKSDVQVEASGTVTNSEQPSAIEPFIVPGDHRNLAEGQGTGPALDRP